MRTALKITSGIMAVLVILVLSVFLVINLVDWNSHRGFIIKNVERYTQVRIDELEGIRVQLWRSTELEVSRFTMHMADEGAGLETFSTGAAQVRIATWPLLFKNQLLVQSLTIDKGRLHLKEVKAKDETPPADEQSGAELLEKLPRIFINLAAITDAEFRYKSLKKKAPMKVSVEIFKIVAPKDNPAPKLSGNGRFDNFPWKLAGEMGSLEAFEADDQPFPFRMEAVLGQQDVSIKGALRFADASGDFSLKAKGPHIEEIKQLFQVNMGRLPAWQIAFDTRLEPRNFKFSKVGIKLGKSEVNGDIQLDLRSRRPKISGRVESPVLTQADFSGLFKTDQRYKPANEPPKPAGQYFSDIVIDNSMMKVADADLRFLVNRYVGEKSGRAIRAWDATIRMNNGDLKIDPVTFAVASGHIGGRFLVDGRNLPLDVQIELGAKRVNLNTLLGPLAKEIPVVDMKPSDMARGLLTGQLDLAMKGKTPMELARSVQGPIELAIEDGKLSGTVIEAFGIDITQTISNWFRDHPLYDLQCALTAFEAKDGAIKTRTFLIATKDTSIVGKGEVNLVANKVDYQFNAHVHDFSIGSVRAPILVKGKLNDLEVRLEKKELLTRSGLAVALGALVNPIAALVPLIETGLDEKGKCRGVVAQLNKVQEKAKRLSSGKTGRVTR